MPVACAGDWIYKPRNAGPFPAIPFSLMSEKPESDEFDEEEPDEVVESGDDVDLDRVIRDMDLAKRRGHRAGEPAWRRLERLLEEKHTAELTSDFDDYDIGETGAGPPLAKKGSQRL